jgi:hypothetical protein
MPAHRPIDDLLSIIGTMTKSVPAILLALFVFLCLLSACNLPMPYTVQTPSGPYGPGDTQAPPAATGLPANSTPGPTPAPPRATEPPAPPSATGVPAATRAPEPSLTPPPPAATPAPESVVMAYLEAYPDGDAAMLATLSQARRASLPTGGPGRLLQVQGDLQGFAIQSGSEIPNPPQAIILVALRAGNKDALRRFTLIRENGAWLIDSISPG